VRSVNLLTSSLRTREQQRASSTLDALGARQVDQVQLREEHLALAITVAVPVPVAVAAAHRLRHGVGDDRVAARRSGVEHMSRYAATFRAASKRGCHRRGRVDRHAREALHRHLAARQLSHLEAARWRAIGPPEQQIGER